MSKRARDVVIIGSGAGGSAMAFALSRAGFDVLVLEKGPHYEREDYPTDEVGSLYRSTFVPPVDDDPHVLVHEDLAAPRPTSWGWTASCVGGGTVHMGGFLTRFHPLDFKMRSHFGPYEALADWPYSYDELEPFLSEAEWEIGVSGRGGVNPHEGYRSREYPMPPLDANPLAEMLETACHACSLSTFPSPKAMNSRPYQGRPACSYCQFCSGFGCRTGARGSAKEALLNRALKTGSCELKTLVMVRKITVDPQGRATGCLYIDSEGREHEARAGLVIVACSSVESARLLLMSKSASFPDGLANDQGLVGRYLQFHSTSSGAGHLEANETSSAILESPVPFVGLSSMDHYFMPDQISGLGKGGVIVFHHRGHYPVKTAKIVSQSSSGETLWGLNLKRALKNIHNTNYIPVSFEVHHDFIPNDQTYMELDPEVRDKWGLPVARMHLKKIDHHEAAGKYVVDQGLKVLEKMGGRSPRAVSVGDTAPFLVQGTCRAGKGPKNSVLNEHCRAHSVPNLFVVDGSFMPTSGGGPPTLTLVANSLRTADHIIRNK